MSVKVVCPECKKEVGHLPTLHGLCFKCLDPYKSIKQATKRKILDRLQQELDDIHSGKKYEGQMVIVNHQTLIDANNVKYFMALIESVEI